MTDNTFSCIRCGICCRRYQVRLSLAEAKHIANTLDIGWDKFARDYLDHRWPGVESVLVRQRRGACLFLKRESKNLSSCLIHPFRPNSCREWTAGVHRSECQKGLAKYWGLQVDAQGALQGTKRNLQRFQSFLESLDNDGTSTL